MCLAKTERSQSFPSHFPVEHLVAEREKPSVVLAFTCWCNSCKYNMSLTVNGFNEVKAERAGLNQAIVSSFHCGCTLGMLQAERRGHKRLSDLSQQRPFLVRSDRSTRHYYSNSCLEASILQRSCGRIWQRHFQPQMRTYRTQQQDARNDILTVIGPAAVLCCC